MNKDAQKLDPEMRNQYSGNILITGGSGFIGSTLGVHLKGLGYSIHYLDRKDSAAPFYYDQASGVMHLCQGIPLDCVINLAGSSIADGRWTQRKKAEIWDSRIKTTEQLGTALAQLPRPPRTILSASAVGFYGNACQEPCNENSPAGEDFLAKLAVAWEKATDPAAAEGIRVVHMRFGLVLHASGGVLANLIAPMGLAVVGHLGNGEHLQSWISLQDVHSAIKCCMQHENFEGPINLIAPEVVTNKVFADTMSEVLRKPQLPAIPAAIVRLMFGEVTDAALLASSNIQSTRFGELGFEPQHPSLKEGLAAAFE